MEIKYNDTFSTSHSSDDVFDFIEKDTTLLDGSRNEVTLFPKPTEVSLNETLYSGYKPQNIQLDEPESSLIKGSSVEIKPILLSDPDVKAQAAFAKSHTRDFYKGRSFRYAGKWEEGVHYINDEYITDFVVKDQVLLVCKKSNMSSWKNNPSEWIYEGDRIVAVVSDYWEVVLAGGIRGKTYLPEYDSLSDSLIWRLVDPEQLPQEFQTYLGIREYVDYALVPIQEKLNDVESDIDVTKRELDSLENDIINLDNGLTNLEIITGSISTHVEDLEGNFSEFVQTAEGFFYKVGDLENNVGQLWLTSQQFGVQLENAEGDISRLTIQADQISTRIENAEGDISQINQRADEISTQVENQQGDISRISQRADQIQSEVENQQGDISRITQRADIIESQVQNLDGDVSTISQRADEIQSQVENVEGDISTITQRADIIESQVESQAGDISRISQTVDNINLRVENAEGNIASLDVRADQITSTVSDQQDQISQIRQTSEEIAFEVAANKVDADNKYTETNSRITQTAADINLEVARVEGKVDTNTRTFTEAINDLQNQIDGSIDTWFYDYAPVHTDEHGVPDSQVPLNVAPYSNWLASETIEEPEKVRDSHVSDIFYDQHSGYAYRFIGTGNPGSRIYTWVVIQDSAVIKALEDAARAQDTADNKRRVFVITPYAPYDLGDLWVKTTTVGNVAATELYKCKIAKTTAGTENISADWEVADSYAKEVSKSNIQILADAIVQQTIDYRYDEYGRLTNETKSAITTGMNDISLAITGSKLETVGIFIRNANVNDNHINLIADKVRIKGTGDHTPTALSIMWDSAANRYKIDVDSLNVNGIFSTSPGSVWASQKSDVLTTSQGYANTAQSNAESTALGYANTAESNAKTAAQGYADTAQSNAISTAATNAATYITNNVIPLINTVDSRVDGLGYLATALNNGTTAIGGGLVLTSLVGLGGNSGAGGVWELWSGINGQYDSSKPGNGIGAWYGGDNVDCITVPNWATMTTAERLDAWDTYRYAKSLFRLDGSGYLASGAITWGASGDLHLMDNIYIGADTSNPFGEYFTFLTKLATWFEDVEEVIGGISRRVLRINMNGTAAGGTDFAGLEFDGFLISGGDQIVGSGTPGSGGGGGATYLSDLEDVSDNLQSPSAGAILQYNATTSLWEGNTPATQIGANVSGIATGKLIYDVLGDNFNSNWTVKQFINSSVATATATYRGSYNEKNDLNLNPSATHSQIALALATVISVADDNDYCFVEIPTSSSTPTEIERTERYKFDGSAWGYEYTLNNSGFTSEQWDAINSGVTSTKISGYDTVVGYFDANGKLGTSHLPNFYLGTTQIRTSSATQDLTGIGNVTMDNAKYLQAYNSAGDTLYNLAGLNASNHGYLGAANSPRTNMRGKTLYFLSGDNGNTSALVINASQAASFYGTVYLQNNKSISWKNKPAEGASEINIDLLNLSSSNVLTLGSGLVATGNNARAYNTYLYGGTIYFYTGDTTTGATRKWYIESAGHFIPNGEYRIGSSSHYVKEAYISKIFLDAGIYLEYVPASGDTPGYAYLNATLAANEAIIGSYAATNAVIMLRNTYGTFKVQAPSSLAAVRIGYGDGPLLVNAAGNVSIESGQALSLKIKRTTSDAGAYMAFYPGNQDTNYWDIGSSADNVFRFEYKGALLDSISTTGAMTIRSSAYDGLSIKRSATGSAGLRFFPDNQDTHYWYFGSYGNVDNYMLRFTYDGSDKAFFFTDGTLRTAGDQVITSDIRMKKNLKPIDLKVEDIAKCRAVTFDWTTGGHSFGSIAQDWEPILPEAVKDGEVKTLAYGQAALVAAINIAKHETEQDKEIRRLQERVKILEDKVKQLKVN